ncbi:MAG: hypothetical protein HN675_03750 [Opitutae bacterium]|nr:hypothetical protein [Opitutae bacterium]MBT5690062.1 hypothetical protein [Opitutae bacterium]MBT7852409.1 hypothetical protein [Opitutae bacterium]
MNIRGALTLVAAATVYCFGGVAPHVAKLQSKRNRTNESTHTNDIARDVI